MEPIRKYLAICKVIVLGFDLNKRSNAMDKELFDATLEQAKQTIQFAQDDMKNGEGNMSVRIHLKIAMQAIARMRDSLNEY